MQIRSSVYLAERIDRHDDVVDRGKNREEHGAVRDDAGRAKQANLHNDKYDLDQKVAYDHLAFQLAQPVIARAILGRVNLIATNKGNEDR